uniref:CSON012223 protein n=1 Tax=Culicoides sonorensis TaxID=179676 RepID=A0A336KKG5_CULSO
MHKRSIFSNRFDTAKRELDLKWLSAFRESKLFPKMGEYPIHNDFKQFNFNKPNKKRLLNHNEWYDSDKISITDRYLLEQKLNVDLMERSERESVKLFISDTIQPIESEFKLKPIKKQRNLAKFCKSKVHNFDKIQELEEILKVELLEETLNEIDLHKLLEQPMKNNETQLKINSSDGKYLCFYCDKRFERSWILSNHMSLHTGARPYICPKCPRSFADRSNLRAHQRSKNHHDWKFSCTQCSMSFHSNTLLKRHNIHSCRRYLRKCKKH